MVFSMRSILAWIRSLAASIVEWLKAKFSKSGEIETPERPERPDGPGGAVCYYGCPNSKRTAALQLGRKRYR